MLVIQKTRFFQKEPEPERVQVAEDVYVPEWFLEGMQVWYMQEDRTARRHQDFMKYKLYKSDLESFEKLNKRIIKDFKHRHKTLWFMTHKKHGKLLAFTLTERTIHYHEFALNHDKYKLWNIFEYPSKPFNISGEKK